MVLRAPADGVVSVIAAEVGENVGAGQPILMVEAAGEQWLSFNVREDHFSGLSIGETVSVMRIGADGAIKAVITELPRTTAPRIDSASLQRRGVRSAGSLGSYNPLAGYA